MNDVRDVVLLHGWGMNATVWQELTALLPPRYRLHVRDLPGYGATPPCVPYTLDAIAAEVARAAPARCQVIGWSLGGLIALAWARAAPEQVVRLALIATTPAFVRRTGWPHAVESEVLAGFSLALAADRAGTLQRFIALQAHGDDNAGRVIRQLRAALAAGGEPAAPALEGGLTILLETDLRAVLASIRQPTLVLQGGRDALVPPGAAEHLSRALPAARLAVLDGAGHAPFVSQPRQVAAALQDLLNG